MDIGGPEIVALVALAWLLFINAITYAAFAQDKAAAERGDWRIAERTLLLMAAVGGSAGAIAAQQRLRHKTRKQPFSAILWLIVAAHAVLLLLLLADAEFRNRLATTVIEAMR